MSEWKEYKLSDLMEIKYGKDHKHLADGSYPLFGSGGIMRYVEKSIYEEESILIPRKGTLSNLFYVNEPFWSVDTMFWSKIIQDLVLPKYLYYTLKTYNLAELNVGSAVPSLTTEVLNKVLISIPNKNTQTSITEILTSLDDKIELNNKINQELESLAQVLFNLICVVDEAQDNDGWRTIKLKDVLSIKNGYAFKGMDFIESGIPVIKIKNVKAGKINFNNLSYVSENIANKAEKFKIKKYDLLITMSGNRIDGSMDTWVGKVGMFPKKGEYLLNQRVSILKLDNIKLKYYLLQLLSSEEYQYHFISNATSSGGQANISPDLINNTEILLPPTEKIEIFDSVASDIYSIIFNNMSENESLIELRDTLLPKLISGELEFNENNN